MLLKSGAYFLVEFPVDLAEENYMKSRYKGTVMKGRASWEMSGCAVAIVFIRSSTIRMKLTHIMEKNLLYSRSTALNINLNLSPALFNKLTKPEIPKPHRNS